MAELDTKPLLEVRGLKMHFPVTDLTRTVRPHLCETRRHSRLALGRGYRGDRRDIRQILLDYLFSFGRRSGRLCGKRADNFLAGPPLLVISLRRPSSSEMLPRLAARPRWCAPDNCLAPHGLRRGEMPAYELPRGPRPVGAASISRSV